MVSNSLSHGIPDDCVPAVLFRAPDAILFARLDDGNHNDPRNAFSTTVPQVNSSGNDGRDGVAGCGAGT